MNYSLRLLILLNVANCQSNQTNAEKTRDTTRQTVPYDLSKPDATLEMPAELTEISGLSLSPSVPDQLCAVQDEQGILFFLDKKTGAVTAKIPFETKGDFEGLEVVGQSAYVVKSSGALYEVKKFDTPTPTVRIIKSSLTKKNNLEGLGYDAATNSLLLACKDAGGNTETFVREVYSFSLKTMELNKKPTYSISNQQMATFIKSNATALDVEDFGAYLQPDEAEGWKFGPSAIAVHPISHAIYLLSSVGKILVVLDHDSGNIIGMQKLSKKNQTQPEGIVFDSDGTLYISNEGKKGTAGNIQRFKMREKQSN